MNATDAPDDAPPASQEAGSAQEKSRGAIDIEALAERVYRLMLAEVRLARARGEWPSAVVEE
jgi:hypothetical protein